MSFTLAASSKVEDNTSDELVNRLYFRPSPNICGLTVICEGDTLLLTQDQVYQLDQKQIRQLLKEASTLPSVGQRMKFISARLLGTPYFVNPLIGSMTEPEVFVATLAGFDCVTFMETVLALARVGQVEGFLELLREIRYTHGKVEWRKRHHYATDWARHNIWHGLLRDCTRGEGTMIKTKALKTVAGLRPRIVSFRYFPKRKLPRISRQLADGDLIFFVSTRKGLDVFHTGIVFREGDRVILRHAARSRGGVVEQELAEFVKANRMPGFIIARPTES